MMTKATYDSIRDLIKRELDIAEDNLFRASVDAKKMPKDDFIAGSVVIYQNRANKMRNAIDEFDSECA